MKTYVITDGSYSDYHIVKIFQCETQLPDEFTLVNLWARAHGLPETPENPRDQWGMPKWTLQSGEEKAYYEKRFNVRQAYREFAKRQERTLLEVFWQWVRETYAATPCEYEELQFDF